MTERSNGTGKKTTWPECVGMTLHAARACISKDFTGAIEVCPDDMGFPCDYEENRVRIMVKDYRLIDLPSGDFEVLSGIVCMTPCIG